MIELSELFMGTHCWGGPCSTVYSSRLLQCIVSQTWECGSIPNHLQGATTLISAILTAMTRVTICDSQNLAVTLLQYLKIVRDPVIMVLYFNFFDSALLCDPYDGQVKASLTLWLHFGLLWQAVCFKIVNSKNVLCASSESTRLRYKSTWFAQHLTQLCAKSTRSKNPLNYTQNQLDHEKKLTRFMLCSILFSIQVDSLMATITTHTHQLDMHSNEVSKGGWLVNKLIHFNQSPLTLKAGGQKQKESH